VGIKVNIEPTIHLNNTVTLKLGLEVSALGDPISFGNGQVQYKFGTRNTDTIVNLRDGETVIIGGLIQDEERKTVVKVPLLGEIPVIGKLFSSSSDGTVKTDILMSISPNIVRGLELPDKDVQSFWSGTEETYDVRPLFVSSAGKSSKPSEKPAAKTAVLDSMAQRGAPAQPGAVETAKLTPPPAGAEPVPAPPVAASLEIKPADAASQVGQEVKFEISAANVKDLYGAIITLGYDPKVVDFKVASEGQLLKKDGQQTSFLFSNNVKAGTVDIYMTRIGDIGGVEGAGGLCLVTFQGKAGGTSTIIVKSMKLTNFNREQVGADAKGATVTVK
jgi:general secretion pathway protein D